jgi:hypothetical protein
VSKIADAAKWLEDYLSRHSWRAASRTIKADGAKAGHSEANLKRARQRLKLKVHDEGFPRVTYWAVPGWEPRPQAQPKSTGMTGADWGAWVRSGNYKRPNSTLVRVI